jgi:maltose-binding protein MalE
MRNKWWIVLTALLIAVLALAGCGGNGGGEEPAAAPTEAPAVETEAAPAETEAAPAETEAAPAETEAAPAETEAAPAETEAAPAETEAAAGAGAAAPAAGLVIWADENVTPVLQELVAPFEEQFGVKVEVVNRGFNNLRGDFLTAAPSGGGPDILYGAHDWIGELNASGLLAPVDLSAKADSFASAAVQGFTYTDGKTYGMPTAVENVAFCINTDLVPEDKFPATWDDVKALSQEIKDAGQADYGFVIVENDGYIFYPIQTAFGGYVFGKNPDGSYNASDLGINSEGTVAAFEWLDSMYADGLLNRNAALTTDLVTNLFYSGDAAMIICGPWLLNGMREAGVPYAITNIPAGTEPGRPFLGVRGFMINAFSPNQLLAQTFLDQFIANDETMQALFEADPRPSAWLAVAEATEDPDVMAYVSAGTNGDPMPNIPEMNSVWQSWGNAMTLISQGKQTPQEALDAAQAQIETAIGG